MINVRDNCSIMNEKFNGSGGIRTRDLQVSGRLLYQPSGTLKFSFMIVLTSLCLNSVIVLLVLERTMEPGGGGAESNML